MAGLVFLSLRFLMDGRCLFDGRGPGFQDERWGPIDSGSIRIGRNVVLRHDEILVAPP